MRRPRSATAAVLGLLLATLGGGCVTHSIAKRIVQAPNRQNVPKVLRTMARVSDGPLKSWRLAVGPPAAELAVAVVEPGDYRMTYDIEEQPAANGQGSFMAVKFSADIPRPEDTARWLAGPPVGTLVLLHGIMMSKESMLVPWGLYFAQQGFRVVIVDLRGHGRSTGEWIGFGVWEAADLVAVADDLERRGLLQGRLGVFGISYGAVMALHWAARDPRIGAVVALAPYSDARRAVVEFARGAQPKLARRISDETFAAAETVAARLAGFDWSETDVTRVLPQMSARVLFFHGEHDDWIAPRHSVELAALAPPGSRREVLRDNHLSLSLRLDPIGGRSVQWFREALVAPSPLTAQ